jgi:signal transduction histidine kinase
MDVLVYESQQQAARELAQLWLKDMLHLGDAMLAPQHLGEQHEIKEGVTLTLLIGEEFEFAAESDPFVSQAIDVFQSEPDHKEYFESAGVREGQRLFRYARAIRKSDMSWIHGGTEAGYQPTLDVTTIADPLRMVLIIDRRSQMAHSQLLLNPIYIIAAGILSGLLAIASFWYITTRLILSPVRVLRDTAQRVAQGDLNIRAEINTGDEFEQLSTMFNTMLTNLKTNQDQLRGINKGLDLKMGELAQTNVTLFEANKVKDEFLANVSHELRTPLNSIIGFAEILGETLKDRTGPVDEKRKRYAANIVTSSGHLLSLINDLLDIAKIEAGRIELHIAPMSVRDTAEGLINLIRPQADKKQIELSMSCPPNLPLIQTDAGKFQQILFNFLANSVKFTPQGGEVTISAKLIGDDEKQLRVSISDNGPGIPSDQHEKIFEKFTQLDSTVTREHTGTGLGLKIARELTNLLMGQIDVESVMGEGATFSLTVPLILQRKSVPLMPPELSELPQTPAEP